MDIKKASASISIIVIALPCVAIIISALASAIVFLSPAAFLCFFVYSLFNFLRERQELALDIEDTILKHERLKAKRLKYAKKSV